MKPINASIIKCGIKINPFSGIVLTYDSIYAYDSELSYDNIASSTYDKLPNGGNINNINPFINLIRSNKPSNASIV